MNILAFTHYIHHLCEQKVNIIFYLRMEQTTGRNSRPLEHREEVIETCAGPETVVNPKTRQDPETAVYEIKCKLIYMYIKILHVIYM